MELGHLLQNHASELKDTVVWNVQRGLDLSMEDHMKASLLRTKIYQRTVTFFETYDYLICPVAQVPPFSLDTEWVDEINGVKMQTYIEWMRVVTDVTIMNCPAISVPAGFTEGGLPIGLQIVGPPRNDLGVLGIAKQFEAATNVGARRPTLA